MDKPPPIPPKETLDPIPSRIPFASPPTSLFPKQAATFSVIAPFVAMGISIVIQPQVRGNRWAMVILGLTSVSLIVLGLLFGIVALVATKRHGRQGIFGKAIAGTSICGLLILLMLIGMTGLIRAAERAKAIQRQRMEQRQQ